MYTNPHLLTLVSISSFFLAKIDADYGECEPVWRLEIPRYQLLAEKLGLNGPISNLALTCDCMNRNGNLGLYTEMGSMVKKIEKSETVDRMIVNKREKQKISKILENLEICQVYMKYEFMRKNMGYLF